MRWAIADGSHTNYLRGLSAHAKTSISTGNRGPGRAVDGSGMDDSSLFPSHVSTQYGESNVWLSALGDTNGWFVIGIGSNVALQSLSVWNFNASATSRGVKTADIYLSASDAVDPANPDFGDGRWTLAIGGAAFAKAPGSSNYDSPTSVDLGGATARYVAIDILANHGDSQYTGLSEVRLWQVPEPAAAALLALGALALGRARRAAAAP